MVACKVNKRIQKVIMNLIYVLVVVVVVVIVGSGVEFVACRLFNIVLGVSVGLQKIKKKKERKKTLPVFRFDLDGSI